MEIIDYVWNDWFVHHIIVNSMWLPFLLYVLLLCGAVSLIYLILKKIIW